MQKPDSKYASDPESASASASASEDEDVNSEDEQGPKKDVLGKVKSLLGFGEEDSDNPSPKASDSETDTENEGDGSEDDGEGEGEGEGEEKPNLKSGFSKLLGSLKNAVKSIGSEGASAAAEVEKINVGNLSSRKGKSGAAAAAASSRRKKSRGVQPTQEELDYNSEDGDEDEDGDSGGGSDDDDGDSKLKKFDKELRNDYLVNFHPESLIQNYDEIYNLARVVRNPNGVIIDNLHKTLPMLTKYEKTRILGQRAKQINDGASPFIKVPEGIIDGYLIALKELEEKKIPFIIRRPLPNRGSEYWHMEDLEVLI
jgi:DNA-directed RNA polymerase I, II, and III subunit RPABC2